MASIAHTNSIICRSIVFLILVTFTVGCTTMQPIRGTDRETLSNQISVGDTVEIAQKTGGIVRFEVDEISESGIGGEGKFIAYRDIRQVWISQISRKSPGGIVLGIVVIVGGVALLLALIENNFAPGFPSP